MLPTDYLILGYRLKGDLDAKQAFDIVLKEGGSAHGTLTIKKVEKVRVSNSRK